MEVLTVNTFEHVEQRSYFICVHVFEDTNYVRTYAASVVINTKIKDKDLTLSLGTGIIEELIEECIVQAAHHAIHLFRDFPQDSVVVIDADGDIEQELSLDKIFEKYNGPKSS